MDPKWSPQLPLIDFSPFPGSLTHFGASRGLQSHKRGPFWAIFWPSLTPPANLVNFFGLFCKKGHFPQQIWLKTCMWTPKHLPDLNPRAGKWAFPGPKKSFRYRVREKADERPPLITTLWPTLWGPVQGGSYERKIQWIRFPMFIYRSLHINPAGWSVYTGGLQQL